MNDDAINDLEKELFPKSMLEFDLGINLAAFMDLYFNPDQYTSEMMRGVLHHGLHIVEVWKEKYQEELRDITNNVKDTGIGE